MASDDTPPVSADATMADAESKPNASADGAASAPAAAGTADADANTESKPSGNKRKVDMGRNEWNRHKLNEKKKMKFGSSGGGGNSSKADNPREWKRRKTDHLGDPAEAAKRNPFSKEEIAAEERRPKRKVAVMIGYSGTGYKGMQLNGEEKTIERDIFRAFVAAGAISKANADDPRKSSLARCARTDKGVHAAGNVISLKLIVEDEDIVDRINKALPDQVRVWGIQRTNNSFNCYQYCDSRWYEYLLPSYCLLPPHPQTYLGRKIAELTKEHGAEADVAERMADVKDFWAEVEEKEIKPILAGLDPEVLAQVLERAHAEEDDDSKDEVKEDEVKDENDQADAKAETKVEDAKDDVKLEDAKTGDAVEQDAAEVKTDSAAHATPNVQLKTHKAKHRDLTPTDYALKKIKTAYISAKRRYRVSTERLQALQAVLDTYTGTKNFHNYTVQKAFTDASAKRHIKSFVVNPEPIIIGGTEWLSLKVHGQSFMMHQIRKMVGLASLVVRCGTPLARVKESFGGRKMAIPKAPGLGLLLERPVFESYSKRATTTLGREDIDFDRYDAALEAFKREHIYTRIFDVEEKENSFHSFFNQIDQFKSNHFLWVTAGGLDVADISANAGSKEQEEVDKQLGDEDEDPEGGEG